MRAKIILLVVAPILGACSPAAGPGQPDNAVTHDAATRTTPVVVGRPARVFVYAALGDDCAPLAPPELRIVTPPAKGELSFRSGQSTSIATATNPKCVGSSVSGTGLYYTAAANAEGSDRFTVEARLQGGAVSSRVFEVRIER